MRAPAAYPGRPAKRLCVLQARNRLPPRRRHCNTALMTAFSVALVNLKPGTGKTTSAVWLAHVFAEAGSTVLLVDADLPAVRWNGLTWRP